MSAAATSQPSNQPSSRSVRALAALGIVAISFSAILVRQAAASPSTAAFFRCLYALPVLGAVWLLSRGSDRRDWRHRLLPAAAGVALGVDFYFWHQAIATIGAGLATVLGNTQVLFVGLAAWAIHRERPTRAALWTVPVVFVGVVLVSGLGRGDAYGSDPLAGTIYGLLTGLTYTIFLLAFRHAGRRLAPVAGPLLDATLGAAAVSLLIGLVVDPAFSLVPSWPQHGWLALLAMVSQVFGWLLLSRALPRLPALETSVLLLMQPMMTVLWAYLLFAEHLSALQWGGVALVLGGIGTLSLAGGIVRAKD
jgi:drug/metabolite transporter (DMT)-like permease